MGKELEVVAGLDEGTVVVLNPTGALTIGAPVEGVETASRGK